MEQAKNWNENFMDTLESNGLFLEYSEEHDGHVIWDAEGKEYARTDGGYISVVNNAEDVFTEFNSYLEAKYIEDLQDELEDIEYSSIPETFSELAQLGEEFKNAPEGTKERNFYELHEEEFIVCDMIGNHADDINLEKAVSDRVEQNNKELEKRIHPDVKKSKDTVERE